MVKHKECQSARNQLAMNFSQASDYSDIFRGEIFSDRASVQGRKIFRLPVFFYLLPGLQQIPRPCSETVFQLDEAANERKTLLLENPFMEFSTHSESFSAASLESFQSAPE